MVGVVSPGSAAEQAGIKPNDLIVSLDTKQEPNWQDVYLITGTNAGRPVPIVLSRNGQKIETSITPKLDERSGTGEPGMLPSIRTVVQDLRPGYPAVAAGLKPNDEIVGVNGVDLQTSGKSLQETIQGIAEKTFPLNGAKGWQEDGSAGFPDCRRW